MVRTLVTSKGQTTIPSRFRKQWKTNEVVWEPGLDGTARVSPRPDILHLYGRGKSAIPKDAGEKQRAREALGKCDPG